MNIGEKIRIYRNQHGMIQADFAAKAGLTRASIEAIENGRIENPGLESLIGIAKAMGISIDELVRE